MIALDGVSKRYRTRAGWKTVLRDVTCVFPKGKNIGVLGRNGAGKSTLMRLLAGAEHPDSGRIHKTVRVSWPLGFSGGLQGSLTGRDNSRFAARIYGVDVRRTVDFVADFAALDAYFDQPVSTYSSGMKGRLALALSLAIDFDIYLIDELPGVSDARFQKRYDAELADRRSRSSIILVSHNPVSVNAQCDLGAILHGGSLTLLSGQFANKFNWLFSISVSQL
jgi:capsular polysaccharide transport system ATP-binding protein